MKKFFLVTFLLICLMVVIETFALQMIWNYVAPAFWSNAPILTFWQVLCIIVLLNFIGSIFKK